MSLGTASGAAGLLPEHRHRFTGRTAVDRWVDEAVALARPDRVVWCDGGDAERASLMKLAAQDGAVELNADWRPGSLLVRTDPGDADRAAAQDFVCSIRPADAGPANAWRDPVAMRAELQRRFAGVMRGRTLYVLPILLGAEDAPWAKVAIQLTDSPAVAAITTLVSRVGDVALGRLEPDTRWIPALHTTGAERGPDGPGGGAGTPRDRVVAHFPSTWEVWSYGSEYAENAVLALDSIPLRLGSLVGASEGWLAEPMRLVRAVDPSGRAFHLAVAAVADGAAFVQGLTSSDERGWSIDLLGSGPTWLRPGDDGRLHALVPLRGTMASTADLTEQRDRLTLGAAWGNGVFVNAALRPDGDVWWEGLTDQVPAGLVDWHGEPWSPATGRPAAHPGARVALPAAQLGTPEGADDVVLDAVVFVSSRASVLPLVAEAEDWADGVLAGATLSADAPGVEDIEAVPRFEPFAALHSVGYDLATHWRLWLDIGAGLGPRAPRVFRVDLGRRDAGGNALWPDPRASIRVVEWMAARIEGRVAAAPSPVGLLPYRHDLDLDGLGVSDEAIRAMLTVEARGWRRECDRAAAMFELLGDRLPRELRTRLTRVRWRLKDYG